MSRIRPDTYTEPSERIARAKQRARDAIKDPSIKLTKLELAFKNAILSGFTS